MLAAFPSVNGSVASGGHRRQPFRRGRAAALAYRCGGSTGFTPVSRLTRDFTKKSRSTRIGCPRHGRSRESAAGGARIIAWPLWPAMRPTLMRKPRQNSAAEVPNHIQNASLTVDRAEFLQL